MFYKFIYFWLDVAKGYVLIERLFFNRQQDVRATEIDKVDMHLSFRPGDIVRAVVVSFML